MPDNLDDRSGGLEPYRAGDFVRAATPPVAGALTAAGIGAVIAGPAGAAVGGVVAVLIPEIVDALDERRKRANEAVNEVVSWTADLSGMSPAELSAWAVSDDERLELLAATVQAALSTLDRIRLRTLARVLAEAVDDDTKLDPSVLITRCIGDLEPFHVRVLKAMATEQPLTGDPLAGEVVLPGTWRESALEERFPTYGSGIPAIMATLDRHALVFGGGFAGTRSDGRTADVAWSMTAHGRTVVTYLAQSASDLGSGGWELREQVEGAPDA